MATWISHLRLAQNLLDAGYKVDVPMFTVGNLSPDCGFPDANGNFTPSPNVTHYRIMGKQAADPERFYSDCLEDKKHDDVTYSFLLGYYAHLFADQEWAIQIYRPKKLNPIWKEGLDFDPEFIWEIKKDWYGLDFLYLEENPDNLFFNTLLDVRKVPDFMDFIPKNRLTENVQRIQEYYQDKQSYEAAHERRYIYLNKQEIDHYIEVTTDLLLEDFAKHGFAKS